MNGRKENWQHMHSLIKEGRMKTAWKWKSGKYARKKSRENVHSIVDKSVRGKAERHLCVRRKELRENV